MPGGAGMQISWEKYCFNKIFNKRGEIMEKAIYKIENKINHKVYIGQSTNPEKRFKQHCQNAKYRSLIHEAIVKYGKDNFSFEVLGWFEDYNEKEKYYIDYYRCLAPNGYNILSGGENPLQGKGENNNFAKISNDMAAAIKTDLKNWKIPRRQITKKYNISENIIRHINEGTSWYDENESYPLRPQEKELNNMRAKKAIELLILTNIPQHTISAELGWGRSAVKEINAGRNHHDDRLIYPIRNHQSENKAILNL
jgi:group I intron endonuclease